MSVFQRILFVITSFILCFMFAIPNLVIVTAVLLSIISKPISLMFCLIFTWNIAKLVEHFYKKSQG